MRNNEKVCGFCELSHTADRMLKVWAPDYINLLIQSANGMYSLLDIEKGQDLPVTQTISLTAEDDESLLVQFLTELLYFLDEKDVVFDTYKLKKDIDGLKGKLIGTKIVKVNQVIKAVTYHNLEIVKAADRLEVQIVFDV